MTVISEIWLSGANDQWRCLNGGHWYRQVGTEPYTRRDGSLTALEVWEGTCAQCGEPFTFKTPIYASKFQPNRRCAKHRRPGSKA